VVLTSFDPGRAHVASGPSVHALACAAMVMACGLVAGEPARAAAPDDAEVASLATRLEGESHVRVLGSFGARQLGAVTVDAAGIHASVTRPALFVPRDAVLTTLVPWAEVRSVEIGRPRGLEGAILGVAAGTLLAVGVVHLFKSAVKEGDTRMAGWAIGMPVAGVCTAAGAWVGHESPQWQQVYPSAMAAR
jgi:hypothetical protein